MANTAIGGIIRIPELPEKSAKDNGLYLPIYDPLTDITYKIAITALLSSESVSATYSPTAIYAIDIIVQSGGKWWQSLQNNNTGHQPTEGAWWTEISRSEADGSIAEWEAGVFTSYPQVSIYGNKLYLLRYTVILPFNSTISPDIDTTNWTGGSGASNEAELTLLTAYNTLGIAIGGNQSQVNQAVEEYITGLDGGGWCNWDDMASDVWGLNYSTKTFYLLQGGCGRILGKKVRFEAQNIPNLPVTYSLYFIAVDVNGLISLQSTINKNTHFPLFHLFVGVSGTYYVGRENHPFSFTQSISNYLHNTLGTLIYGSGGNVAIGTTNTQIAIQGAAMFSDHGLESPIPDTAGIGVTWIQDYKNTSSQWAAWTFSANMSAYYNKAGTPTSLTSGRVGVYRLYVTKDDGNYGSESRYVAIMHNSEYVSQAAALTAINAGQIVEADGLLRDVEIAQLGYAIVSSAGVVLQTIVQKKTAVTGTSGGTTGLSAVAYDGLHSSTLNKNSDTNYLHHTSAQAAEWSGKQDDLGIDPINGSATLFLNEQGNWVPAGGGENTSTDVILTTPLLGAANQDEYNIANEADKNDIKAQLSSNQLTFASIYGYYNFR